MNYYMTEQLLYRRNGITGIYRPEYVIFFSFTGHLRGAVPDWMLFGWHHNATAGLP